MSGSSEPDIALLAQELAQKIQVGDRVLLEGPMGVGKTTFARSLLASLGVHQPPEGSPTFALAHEYNSPKGGIVHIDFYRIQSEFEIDDAGISAYYWERKLIVISEWTSSWPEFQASVLESGRCWFVTLGFDSSDAALRQVEITCPLKDEEKFVRT